MPAIARIAELASEFAGIRRQFHEHPELSNQEFKTAEKIAEYLKSWGIEVHTGIGVTGVVGVLKNGTGSKRIALRADMDALPVTEANHFAHASKNPGVMHACGHDGHITGLLLAARYLSETRHFNGTINFVFQPGEEGGFGAQHMIADGLMEKFPADFYLGCHNWPETPAMKVGINKKAMMASGNVFRIDVKGRGSHGAMPNLSIDPIFTALQICQSIQGIVTRMKRPIDPAVLSICKIEAGTTYNVVPDSATILGTVRTFDDKVTNLFETELDKISTQVAQAFGATAKLTFTRQYSPVVNTPECVDRVQEAVRELYGEETLHEQEPVMPSEDFADYLQKCPGAFFFVGSGDGSHRDAGHGDGPCALHNSSYDFNDACLPIAASVFARVAENYLK